MFGYSIYFDFDLKGIPVGFVIFEDAHYSWWINPENSCMEGRVSFWRLVK